MDKISPSVVYVMSTPRSVKPKFLPCFCRVWSALGVVVFSRQRGDTIKKGARKMTFVQEYVDPLVGMGWHRRQVANFRAAGPPPPEILFTEK
jgi:hypothetical protein